MAAIRTHSIGLPLTVEIVETIAECEGVDVMMLPPLFDVVDTDALNMLFANTRDRMPNQPIQVSFEYCGYSVAIDQDRTITAEESEK